jgi:hypothetical protein
MAQIFGCLDVPYRNGVRASTETAFCWSLTWPNIPHQGFDRDVRAIWTEDEHTMWVFTLTTARPGWRYRVRFDGKPMFNPKFLKRSL